AGVREVTVDLGLCTFCGECEGEAVRMTRDFECAARDRAALVERARYTLNPDGTHEQLVSSTEAIGGRVRESIHRTFGRSLALRAFWRQLRVARRSGCCDPGGCVCARVSAASGSAALRDSARSGAAPAGVARDRGRASTGDGGLPATQAKEHRGEMSGGGSSG